MAANKEEEKAARERDVFERFSRMQGWASPAATIESRPTPEPDILFTRPGESPVAFELVEFIDRDFARTMESDKATQSRLQEAFNDLHPEQRQRLEAAYANADVSVAFAYGVTERQRAKAANVFFEYLAALPGGWSGIKLRVDELPRDITQIIVSRGSFSGPLFSVASGIWVGDPAAETVKEKVGSTYSTPYPIELLCHIESNPMFPEAAWMGELAAYCSTLTKCPFRAIYVFDDARNAVVFSWLRKASS